MVNRAYQLGEYIEIYDPVDSVLFEAAMRRGVELLSEWLILVVDGDEKPDSSTAAQAWMAADVAWPMDLAHGLQINDLTDIGDARAAVQPARHRKPPERAGRLPGWPLHHDN